jgi:hypothetical protein
MCQGSVAIRKSVYVPSTVCHYSLYGGYKRFIKNESQSDSRDTIVPDPVLFDSHSRILDLLVYFFPEIPNHFKKNLQIIFASVLSMDTIQTRIKAVLLEYHTDPHHIYPDLQYCIEHTGE